MKQPRSPMAVKVTKPGGVSHRKVISAMPMRVSSGSRDSRGGRGGR